MHSTISGKVIPEIGDLRAIVADITPCQSCRTGIWPQKERVVALLLLPVSSLTLVGVQEKNQLLLDQFSLLGVGWGRRDQLSRRADGGP